MMRALALAIFSALVSVQMVVVADDDAKDKPAANAYAILNNYCGKCHHEAHRGNKDYDVLSLKSLEKVTPSATVMKKFPEGKSYLVPKKPDQSLIWLRAGVKKDMPPRDPKPSDDELESLKKWVEEGARSQ